MRIWGGRCNDFSLHSRLLLMRVVTVLGNKMGRKVCFEGRNLWGGIASFFQLVGTYIDQEGIHGNLRRALE